MDVGKQCALYKALAVDYLPRLADKSFLPGPSLLNQRVCWADCPQGEEAGEDLPSLRAAAAAAEGEA